MFGVFFHVLKVVVLSPKQRQHIPVELALLLSFSRTVETKQRQSHFSCLSAFMDMFNQELTETFSFTSSTFPEDATCPPCLVLESPDEANLDELESFGTIWACPDGKEGRLYRRMSPNSEEERKGINQSITSLKLNQTKKSYIASNVIRPVPECCRFLLFPFPTNGILCLSWLSGSSNVPSLTLWVPVLPRLPRASPEPIRGSVAPLTL